MAKPTIVDGVGSFCDMSHVKLRRNEVYMEQLKPCFGAWF